MGSSRRRRRGPRSGRGPRRPHALLTVAALAAAAWLALRLAPSGWIDGTWSQTVLPAQTAVGAALVAAVPWSWSAVSLIAVAVALIAAAVAGRPRPWWALALATLTLAGATFELAWGVGYRRTPLEARLALPTTTPTPDELRAAVAQVTAIAIGAAPGDPSALDADAPWPGHEWRAAAACVAAADAAVLGRSAPLPLAGAVRRVPAGALLAGGFSGFVGPWWREPHLDAALPPAAALATGLHELTHAAGWAREAETDALATLAGLACADPEVRFAASVHALTLLRAELARGIVGAAPSGIDPAVPAEVARADAALREVLVRHVRPRWRSAVGGAYDGYLRAQGVSAGLADYGRAGVLVAAALGRCPDDPGAPLCPGGRSASASP
jgi:hypothetical protein